MPGHSDSRSWQEDGFQTLKIISWSQKESRDTNPPAAAVIFRIDFVSLIFFQNPSFQINCTQRSEALRSDCAELWGAAASGQALLGPRQSARRGRALGAPRHQRGRRAARGTLGFPRRRRGAAAGNTLCLCPRQTPPREVWRGF